MNNTPGKMRFEQSAAVGIDIVRATYSERGQQYADTLETCDWLMTGAVAKSVIGIQLPKEKLRLIGLAAMVDMKHERMLGGFKADGVIDLAAYTLALIGELSRDGMIPPHAQSPS